MKKVVLVLGALLVLVVAAAAIVHFLRPRDAATAFERASRIETRFDEKIRLEKARDTPDAEAIDEREARIQTAWSDVIERWPETPEAERAAYRLFKRRLDLTADAREKVRLIDEFLAAHPDHEEKKDLMVAKARLYRFDLKDPLQAIASYKEIEAAFPDDPVAAEAAMTEAQIYEEINEAAAAADAYKRLAETYPDSKQAVEAQMRQARLLEEKLDRKREAAEAYEAVAAANPGTRAGREAAGASRRLLGEMQQTDREEYYDRTYGVTERDPYRITQEELNGPAMRRMRAQGFDLRHYDLAVDLHPRDSRIDVEARISGRLAAPLAEPLLLQLNPALDVESVEIGGAAARNLRRGPHIEIVLPDGAEGDLDLTVRYGGKVGMWFDDRLTTEGASLRSEARWVPQSHFGDMFTQAVTIEAPQNYRAISQGAEQADSGRAASNPARRVWSYRQDKPSQFTTIALGRYERLAFEGPRGLAMEVDLLPEHKDQLDAYRRAMLQSVETFEAIYGAFPFERLAVAEVPDFPGGYGAASLVLVGSIAFPENGAPVKFLAHEIAHQWWGNRVSLDLTEGSIPWLSEAFATYSDAVFTERTVGADAFLSQVLAMGNFYRENILLFEDRPIAETLWSHPMYRSLMYEKGALVIHSLRREMGDEPFFTALRRFLEEHPYQVVKVESLARIASDVAGRDLGWFFDEQLGRAGYARVRIENATAAEQAGAWTVELQLSQQDPAYRMAMDVEIETEDGPQRAEIVAEGAASTHQLGVRARPIRVRLDPDHWRLIDPRSEFVERTVTPRPGGCIPRIRGKDGDLM